MMYLLLKALHIVALMAWVAGMLAQAFLLRTLARLPLPHMPDERSVIVAAARWDRLLIAPAMMLAWACGLALASKGHWWPAPWLSAKLALVVALSVLHGYQGGSLRRMARQGARGPAPMPRLTGALILGAVAAIVLLVVLKPKVLDEEKAPRNVGAGPKSATGVRPPCGCRAGRRTIGTAPCCGCFQARFAALRGRP